MYCRRPASPAGGIYSVSPAVAPTARLGGRRRVSHVRREDRGLSRPRGRRSPRGHILRSLRLDDLLAHQALDRGIGDAGGDQADRADRVVVGRDQEVDAVRVAVGVDDRDRSGSSAGAPRGSARCSRFGIDDEDGARQLGHVAHAAERPLQPLELLELVGGFLLRQVVQLAALGLALELLEVAQPVADRDEVGQRAAEPAPVDVELAGALGLAARRPPGPASWCRRRGSGRRGRSGRRRSRAPASSSGTVCWRSMMWMPLRSVKMYGFIFGFQRFVW